MRKTSAWQIQNKQVKEETWLKTIVGSFLSTPSFKSVLKAMTQKPICISQKTKTNLLKEKSSKCFQILEKVNQGNLKVEP